MALLALLGIGLAVFISTSFGPDLPATTSGCSATEIALEDGSPSTEGLYDLAGHDELSLEVIRLASQPVYESTLGYYLACADGTPLGGQVIWPNAALGGPIEFTIELEQWPDAQSLGFFLIPHGASHNQLLKNRDLVSFAFHEGAWVALHGGKPLKGRNASLFTSDARLNTEGTQQVLFDASTGILHWKERPAKGDASEFRNLKELVRISSSKTTARNAAPSVMPPERKPKLEEPAGEGS